MQARCLRPLMQAGRLRSNWTLFRSFQFLSAVVPGALDAAHDPDSHGITPIILRRVF